MQRRIGLIALAMLAMLAGPALAVKVAVAPPPYLEGKTEEGDLFAVAACLWFRESLAGAPGVEIQPEPRNGALFQEIRSGGWVYREPSLHPRYSRFEPVDAVLSFQGGEKPAIHLDTAAGRRSFTPAASKPAALMEELRKAALFVAGGVPLGADAAAAVSGLPKLDGETFQALCQARQTLAPWPRNSGEARLILLQPGWKKHPADPRVCAAVLSAAAMQFQGKTRDDSYNATALNMARMALPAVLGSPYEGAALELAAAIPAEAVTELSRIAGALLKEATGGKMAAALDDLLEAGGEEEAPAPAAGGAWASGTFTRAQMLGAVRVLARMTDKPAQELAARLEKHPEADVKQALAEARAAGNRETVPFRLPEDLSRERLLQLANDPDGRTAGEARRRLADSRPADAAGAAAFDLMTAHFFVRLRLLEELGKTRPPWATEVLEEAAARNPDPFVRAQALLRLAALDPDRAKPLARAALEGDSHRLIRMSAALIAWENVKKGTPARSVNTRRNLAWVCGLGDFGPESPFDAYYCLSMPTDLALWKRAYDKGKIFFVRLSTVGNPGLIAVNRQYRDRFWQDIERALTPEVLPMIDGLVFGEETMKTDPDGLWEDGWRLFCEDLKIDPARVAGDKAKLTGPEAQAWRDWGWERCVDGFNMLYDFVKVRYAAERPDLQVCTFLPGEPGSPGLRRWKFDVGGIYDYKCDSRMSAYSLVRRIRTLWPDRPVIWLSLGIGGYEMNPVKRTQSVPEQPMRTRRIRSYADAVAAWMAGADTGWFSVWIFVEPNFGGDRMAMSGVQVNLEDIGAGSRTLKSAVEYAFKGAEADLSAPKAPKKVEAAAEWDAGAKVAEEEMTDLADLVTGRDRQAEAKQSVAERKAVFARGFLFYQQYVYDCARVCRSLPRLPPRRFPVLAVYPGATVWTTPPTPNPLVPGQALPNAFDFLSDLKESAQIDLAPYKVILVRDPGPQPAAVVEALTAWLEKTDGLLYIQGGFDAEAEWGNAANLSGRLAKPWPWAGEVVCRKGPAAGRTLKPLALRGPGGAVAVQGGQVACVWSLSGARAAPLLEAATGTVLAVWRDPARFKGAVVFDGVESASRDYILALRDRLGQVCPAAAPLLAGPVLHGVERVDGVTAAATTGHYRDASDAKAYDGLDLLTGEAGPDAGRGLAGLLAATNYASGHAAVFNGVSLLAEQPLTAEHAPSKVEPVPGGLRVTGGGLLRLAGGRLKIEADGKPLPAVTNGPAWIVEGGGTEGLLEVAAGTNGVSVYYVRSRGLVSALKETP